MHTHSLMSQTRCCLSEGMSACAGKVTGGLCAPRTSYMWGRLQRDPREVHGLTCGAAGANKGTQVTNSHALLVSLCPYPRREPRSEFPGAQRYTPWGGIGAGPSAAAASTCSQWPGGRQTPCATAGSSQLLSYSLLLHSTNEDSQINLPWLCFLVFDIIIFWVVVVVVWLCSDLEQQPLLWRRFLQNFFCVKPDLGKTSLFWLCLVLACNVVRCVWKPFLISLLFRWMNPCTPSDVSFSAPHHRVCSSR